jgi:hypothetical protein
MAKVSYASLKLKIEDSVKRIEGTEIEVLQYLPIEDKYDLIRIALQKSKIEGLNSPIILDMYFHLFIVYMYTNISFTDKQKENEYKIYDSLKSNGILDKVLEAIPENEYNDLITFLAEELELKERYDLSVSGLISRVINDLPANAEAAMKIVDGFDKEKFENVIDFAKSINNGQMPLKN